MYTTQTARISTYTLNHISQQVSRGTEHAFIHTLQYKTPLYYCIYKRVCQFQSNNKQ